jgi:acetoin utilization deacetylase AcuC-like enzyme
MIRSGNGCSTRARLRNWHVTCATGQDRSERRVGAVLEGSYDVEAVAHSVVATAAALGGEALSRLRSTRL